MIIIIVYSIYILLVRVLEKDRRLVFSSGCG